MKQKLGEESSQTESEQDLEGLTPKLVEDSVVFSTDWTAETISSQLSKGSIDLDPAFQRRDAWTLDRKSRFIESIILGLPIPQIVLAEKKNAKGSFIVLDGKQRLLSIQKFTTPALGAQPLALKGLKLRADLNGLTFSELRGRPDDLRAFENQPIRTVIIRNWVSEDVLYLIFHRLNSESLPLSAQELRQALHPGPFLTFADKHSFASPQLRKTLERKEPDFRMRDVELLVRLYAFRNFAKAYNGNLKEFLDRTCSQLNADWSSEESQLRTQAEEFEAAINLAFDVFGRPFRKWDGKDFERRFNRAVFDIIVYFFSLKTIRDEVKSRSAGAKLLARFQDLCRTDTEFLRSIETTTKSKASTAKRFTAWADVLSSELKIAVNSPL